MISRVKSVITARNLRAGGNRITLRQRIVVDMSQQISPDVFLTRALEGT